MRNIGKDTNRFPKSEYINAFFQDKFHIVIPIGIDNRNSVTGNIAKIKTFNSGSRVILVKI
jgi:hypothetical protein